MNTFTQNFRQIRWGKTLWYSLLRSICAGFVIGMLMFIFPESEGNRMCGLEGSLFYPFAYFFIFFPMGIVFFWLQEFPFVRLLSGYIALCSISLGDPIIYIMHKFFPRLVPIKSPPFFSFLLIFWVFDEQESSTSAAESMVHFKEYSMDELSKEALKRWQDWDLDGNIFFAPDIPQKKLNNALQQYAPEVAADQVLVLVDGTILGSAKEGCLFTKEYFCSDGIVLRNIKITLEISTKASYDNNYLKINDLPFCHIGWTCDPNITALVNIMQEIISWQGTTTILNLR